MMLNKNRKLKNYLVYPEFQLRYAFVIGISAAVLVFTVCIIFYLYLKDNYQLLIDLTPVNNEVKALLQLEINKLFWTTSAIALFFLIIITVFSLILSHKIAGAVFNIRKTLKTVRTSDKSARIRLRKVDEFQELAVEINETLDTLAKSEKL